MSDGPVLAERSHSRKGCDVLLATTAIWRNLMLMWVLGGHEFR